MRRLSQLGDERPVEAKALNGRTSAIAAIETVSILCRFWLTSRHQEMAGTRSNGLWLRVLRLAIRRIVRFGGGGDCYHPDSRNARVGHPLVP